MDLIVPADHRMKTKKRQNDKEILGSCQRVKKLWNIRVIVILTVVDALRMIYKGLGKRLKELKSVENLATYRTQYC